MGEGKNQGGQEGSSKFSQSPRLALMDIKMKPMALVSESLHPLTASLRAPLHAVWLQELLLSKSEYIFPLCESRVCSKQPG